MSKALILFPHQLFEPRLLPKVDRVYLVEEPLLFGYDEKYPINMHVHKLILHRASMRRYVEEVLWPHKIDVEYVETKDDWWTGKILTKAAMDGHTQIAVFDPVDDVLESRLKQTESELPKGARVHWLDTPNFYLKTEEVSEYFEGKHEHLFDDFYQWQRERFGILLTRDFKPVGGKWHFEPKQVAHKKSLQPPGFHSYGDSPLVAEAKEYISKRFNHYHGDPDGFMWPTSHEEAREWLSQFVHDRLEKYAGHMDTLDSESLLIFHSGISPLLNTGLLDTKTVIAEAVTAYIRKPSKIDSLENFVRQIVGWREFMRGVYVHNRTNMRSSNYFKQSRSLTRDWYAGTTGLEPLDAAIKKATKHGYLHSNERLMIVGAAMLMCEIKPDEVYRWFSEMTIDSYDWCLTPNVYGLSQFSDGGMIAAAPQMSSSAYLRTVGDYSDGEWADVWDGLYWRFIESNRSAFSKNEATKALVKELDELDADRKRVLGYRAGDFLAAKTQS